LLRNNDLNKGADDFSTFLKINKSCKSVFNSDKLDDNYIAQISNAKRFIERFIADAKFRELFDNNPADTLIKYKQKIAVDDARYLSDEDFIKKCKESGIEPSTCVKRYQAFKLEGDVERAEMRELDQPSINCFKLWRERQINRCFIDLKPQTAKELVHIPFAIELSDGCSVGCWFCGLTAKRKTKDFLYSDANKKMWRGILSYLGKISGTTGKNSSLYWATDPFDNPDYEKFAVDFHDIFGTIPRLTTALATKEIERTRKIAKQAFDNKTIHRLSILSLSILNIIHENFTAKELLFVKLITQNSESLTMVGNIGKAYGTKKIIKKAQQIQNTEFNAKDQNHTIACLSGFLINMVERTIKLITPCLPDSKYKDGYWTLKSSKFNSVEEFKHIIDEMTNNYMLEFIEPKDPIAFNPKIKFESGFSSFKLISKSSSYKINTKVFNATTIGNHINSKVYNLSQLVLHCEEKHNINRKDSIPFLNSLFQKGFFNEEPRFFTKV